MKRIVTVGSIIAIILAMCRIGLTDDYGNWNKQDSQLFEEVKKEHSLDDASAYQVLGLTFLKQEFLDKASICFERAVQIDQRLFLSWYHLGLINMDSPEAYFKKAIEANPKFPLSYYWLAMYYQQNGKQPESVRFFEKYLQVVDKSDPQEKQRIKVAEETVKNNQYHLCQGPENQVKKIMDNEVGIWSYETKEFDLYKDGRKEAIVIYAFGTHQSGARVIRFDNKNNPEIIFEHVTNTANTEFKIINGIPTLIFVESGYVPDYATGKRYKKTYKWNGKEFRLGK